MGHCFFLPPYLADKLPEGHSTLSRQLVAQRLAATGQLDAATATADPVALFDARHTTGTSGVRTTRADVRAAEVDDALNKTLEVYADLSEAFGKTGVAAYVHFGTDYDNAYWDGTRMVFGDGDGKMFGPFTNPPDIGAHELTHGLTGDKLNYSGQAGALNESMSDCMGAYVRQCLLGLTITDPRGWLIGEGLLLEKGARALRDMLNPGTAYNTAQLGRDPQPAHMRDYDPTTDDDGGVHTNSGIPNRAFALASQALGSTRAAMVVWLRALDLLHNPGASFKQFATMTVAAATPQQATQVQQAWATVGVLSAPVTPAPAPAPAPMPAPTPTPAPTPAPTTGAACFPGASVEVADGLARRAAKRGMTLGAYQEWFWRGQLNLPR